MAPEEQTSFATNDYIIDDDFTTPWPNDRQTSGDQAQKADTTETNLEYFNKTSTLEHVIAVTLFATFSIVGNSLVIHIFRRKSGNGNVGNLYLIMLAATDIFACCTLLPLYPFIRYMYRDDTLIALRPFVFLLQNLITFTYLWILCVMALERALAVFRPFTFRFIRRRFLGVAFAWLMLHYIFVSDISLKVTPFGSSSVLLVSAMLELLVSVLIITVSYSSIAIKLYMEGKKIAKFRKTEKSRASNMTNKMDQTKSNDIKCDRSARHVKTNVDTNMRRSLHITSIKLAIVIITIFIVSFVPSYMAIVFDNFYLSYMTFVNHVANPFGYYIVNRQFRHDLNSLLGCR